MNDFYLRKDELNFIERKLRRDGLSWDEIRKRKDKIKEHLKILVLKEQKEKKRELTDKEKDMLFKEEYAKMVERDSR